MLLSRYPSEHYCGPYEREYETWCSLAIEEYFRSRRREVVTFAFSPHRERVFPADAIIRPTEGERITKAFALQFKMPHRNDGSLRWDTPKPQKGRIAGLPIYYALPTFLNRKAKYESLSHTLFWNPDWNFSPTGELITVNEASVSTEPPLQDMEGSVALRWGAFVEHLEGCSVGSEYYEFVDVLNRCLLDRDYFLGDDNDPPSLLIVLIKGIRPVAGPIIDD